MKWAEGLERAHKGHLPCFFSYGNRDVGVVIMRLMTYSPARRGLARKGRGGTS